MRCMTTTSCLVDGKYHPHFQVICPPKEGKNLSTYLLTYGDYLSSPGCSYTYQVVGPCCNLFDREELPWPSCSLGWKGKQPSWRREGIRFTPDLASKSHPTYSVHLTGGPASNPPSITYTLFHINLEPQVKEWWYTPTPKLRHYLHELPTHWRN